MEEYAPSLSAEEIAKRKKRQEVVYESFKQFTKPTESNILGFKITVLPGMFPTRWEDTVLLGEQVLAEVKETDFVLDLGCGCGRLSRIFASEGATVTGIDFSAKAVEKARQKSSTYGPSLTFEQADLSTMRLVGVFDIVASCACITFACRKFCRNRRCGRSAVAAEVPRRSAVP